jgi:hypothetical protein
VLATGAGAIPPQEKEWKMKIAGIVFIGLLVGALVALVFAFPTMLLWNWLMPNLFGLPIITFWESLGLCILARFLFGAGASSSSSK